MGWKKPEQRRFADDVERMGYEAVEYHGRWGYHGPAVKCSAAELQDVLRATEVRVMWESLGKGWVIYPEDAERLAKVRAEHSDKMAFDRALKDLGVEWKEERS